MNELRITKRFYFFLIVILALAALLLRQLISLRSGESIVDSYAASQRKRVQGVIMRDEAVTYTSSSDTVDFVALEGAHVAQGTDIAYAYTGAYSTKEILSLHKVQLDIRAYHAELFKNIVEAELEHLDSNVRMKARDIKGLVNGAIDGNLYVVEQQLIKAMANRQEYLSQKRREDSKLNALYDEETNRKSKMAAWRSILRAERAGTVSFYLDGREQFLSPGNFDAINADRLRGIMRGEKPDQAITSRQSKPVYRMVSDTEWYVLLIASEGDFNASIGQLFNFQMDGFSDVIYTGMVDKIQNGIVALRVTDLIGPLINQRSGSFVIGATISGLLVPVSSIKNYGNQVGVYLSDRHGGSFIPVQVLSSDSKGALVRPIIEGSLVVGQYVKTN